MKDIRYYKNILSEYDHTFDTSYFFEYERVDNMPFCPLDINRKVIETKHLINYIYLSTLKTETKDKGTLITFHDKKIYLINVGSNVYYLAHTELKGLYLYSILYTFMINNRCYIDISKFPHLFNMFNHVSLYKII